MAAIRRILSAILPPSLFGYARALSRERDRQQKQRSCQEGLRFIDAHFSQFAIRLLDIGARDGVPIGEIPGLPFFPRVKITGIEPDAEEARRLEVSSAPLRHRKVFPVAVWSDSAARVLNVTAHTGCASLLEPDEPRLSPYAVAGWFKVVRRVPVQLTTLDQLFAQGETFDFIKADVQGGELDVFLGGERLLRAASGLIFEAHSIPLYRQQKTFESIHAYCTTAGFRLIHLLPAQSFDGEVVELNCAYVRDPFTAANADAFLKALVFSLLLYNRDYAEFLLRNLGPKYLGEAECAGLLQAMQLSLQSARPIPAESRA